MCGLPRNRHDDQERLCELQGDARAGKRAVRGMSRAGAGAHQVSPRRGSEKSMSRPAGLVIPRSGTRISITRNTGCGPGTEATDSSNPNPSSRSRQAL